MFTTPAIKAIGSKYGKSVAQIILRFLIQSDVVVIPKTTHKERMIQNIDVFDFSLDEEEMKVMASLDLQESAFFSHYDPEMVEFLTGLIR
jgi:diketogulonate reductase-like aldo/keto reductase